MLLDVFSSNGYPKCTGVHGRSDSLPTSLVCPNNQPLEAFSDTIDMRGTISDLHFASARQAAAKAAGDTVQPFFLAFGAHRPHLPWNIPQQ